MRVSTFIDYVYFSVVERARVTRAVSQYIHTQYSTRTCSRRAVHTPPSPARHRHAVDSTYRRRRRTRQAARRALPPVPPRPSGLARATTRGRTWPRVSLCARGLNRAHGCKRPAGIMRGPCGSREQAPPSLGVDAVHADVGANRLRRLAARRTPPLPIRCLHARGVAALQVWRGRMADSQRGRLGARRTDRRIVFW